MIMVTCNLSLWSVQCKYSVLFEILSKRLECELLCAVPQTLMYEGGGQGAVLVEDSTIMLKVHDLGNRLCSPGITYPGCVI